MNEFSQLYHITQPFKEVVIVQKAKPWNDQHYRRL